MPLHLGALSLLLRYDKEVGCDHCLYELNLVINSFLSISEGAHVCNPPPLALQVIVCQTIVNVDIIYG